MILQIFREEFTDIKRKRRIYSALSRCWYNLPTSMVLVSPRVGSHKLFELIHLSDTLDILFFLEPFLDGWSIEVQSVTLADIGYILNSHRSIYCRFWFAKQLANIIHAHKFSFERLWLLLLTNCLFECFNSLYQILNELRHLLKWYNFRFHFVIVFKWIHIKYRRVLEGRVENLWFICKKVVNDFRHRQPMHF